MMDTCTGYKDRAIASLEGKWGDAAIVTLIYMLITSGVGLAMNFTIFRNASFLWTLATIQLAWGFIIIFLNVARGQEKIVLDQLFDGYRGNWSRILVTMLLKMVYTMLWMLLLIVPGIIKSYSYAMTEYILKDDPEITENAAIEKSMQMMEGHKMKLFLLDLSFIGWALLSILSCGIGFFFLEPYMCTARAHFYEDLKQETPREAFING